MDRKTIAIVALSFSAAFLAALNINSTPTARAEAVVAGRDYQAITTQAQQGGESLYVLDNKTGMIAVFLYDSRDKTVRARAVRSVRDAFAGR